MSYTVVLNYDADYDGYTAAVPALPGCMTAGKTIPQALEMAKEAIGLYVEEPRAWRGGAGRESAGARQHCRSRVKRLYPSHGLGEALAGALARGQ